MAKASPVVKNLLKVMITVAIFVAIFLEFGGGFVEVSSEGARTGQVFQRANPEMPGMLGKLKARVTGTPLPEARIPVVGDEVCRAGVEGPVFVTTLPGDVVKFKPLRHCSEDHLEQAYRRGADGKIAALSLEDADGSVLFHKQGFQLVPMDMKDLWEEIKGVKLSVFLPWFLFAMVIKLVGIFANVVRWAVLLRGQGITTITTRYLTSTYFVGRYFGIVTPSTMGLDGWRLYDTIRLTRKPIECTTAIAVERIIGLVGLLTVILIFMPFTSLENQSLGELVAATRIPLAAAVIMALLVLLQPQWFTGFARFVPWGRARRFLEHAIESATAYSSRRGSLLLALGCAVFGQITTMFMYFGNAMALQVVDVSPAEILYASAVMTLGTFLAPTASGEGVRELVFVALLGGKTTAAKAFLIGHLGFWIEKLPLSIPGGILLFRQPEAFKKVTREDLERLKAETQAESEATKGASS